MGRDEEYGVYVRYFSWYQYAMYMCVLEFLRDITNYCML